MQGMQCKENFKEFSISKFTLVLALLTLGKGKSQNITTITYV